MGNQTSARPQFVMPDSQETGSDTSPAENRVHVDAYEMVEVWVVVSAFASGSITQVDIDSSPLKAEVGALVAANFDTVKSFGSLTIGAVGSFFLGAISRQNSEGLGSLAEAAFTMTGDITFAIILLGKE